jgi:hypothetical protein
VFTPPLPSFPSSKGMFPMRMYRIKNDLINNLGVGAQDLILFNPVGVKDHCWGIFYSNLIPSG